MVNALRQAGEQPPNYDGLDSEWFTVQVFHGGQLEVIKDVSSKYLGGEIDFFDFCSRHYMSMFELLDFASRLGYDEGVKLFYKPQGGGSFGSFAPLQTQLDVVELVKMLNEDRMLEVYMVVPAKPIKLDFTYCAEKPIELSSDEDMPIDDDSDDSEGHCSDLDESEHDETHVPESNNAEDRNKNPVESNSPCFTEDVAASDRASTPYQNSFEGHDLTETSSSSEESEYSSSCTDSWSTDVEDSPAESDEFRVGKVYANPDELRKAIREYSIISRRGIVFKKNESRRVRAVCRPNCPWLVFASSIGDDMSDTSLVVKTFNGEHTCSRVFQKKWVTDSWLADRYASNWNANSKWKRSSFDKEVRRTTGGKVSRSKFYRSRRKSLDKLHGTTDEQYSRMWEYCGALKESNPGSTVEMMVSDDRDQPTFKQIYVCFEACKKGWVAGCRSIIGMAGCKIKVPIGMQLLTAVGIDADNDIYPIAFAIVEYECVETWSWFLSYLALDLGLGNSASVTWISDKENGLDDIIKNRFPQSKHRLCVKHLYSIFKRIHPQLHLKPSFWNAAKARTTLRFDKEMEHLKMLKPEAHDWLQSQEPANWSRAFFSHTTSCDMIVNKMCAEFHALIADARDKPIITCIETIRRHIMKLLVDKKESASNWKHEVGPRILKKIEQTVKESSASIAHYCGEDKFEVRCDNWLEHYRVDLTTKTCDCNKWQLTGLPCGHAMSCILSRQNDPYHYVDIMYRKSTFVKAYAVKMNTLSGPSMWKKTNSVPPCQPSIRKVPHQCSKRKRQKPKEIRVDGTSTTKLKRTYIRMTCRTCGLKDHNSVGCPGKCVKSSGSGRPRAKK